VAVSAQKRNQQNALGSVRILCAWALSRNLVRGQRVELIDRVQQPFLAKFGDLEKPTGSSPRCSTMATGKRQPAAVDHLPR